MFAFAKQLVKSAEGIINQPAGESAPFYGQSSLDPSHGFRVLFVKPNSTAEEAGFESLFDFIVGLNGHDIVPSTGTNDTAPGSSSLLSNYYPNNLSGNLVGKAALDPSEIPPIIPFTTEIANCGGRSVSFDVWSAKGRIRRTITVPVSAKAEKNEAILNTSDQGDTQETIIPNFDIGISLQWTPLSVSDHVWHVLDVAPNSPADKAGLISHSDYIVAAENGILEAGGEDLLSRVVSRIVANHNNKLQEQLHQSQEGQESLEPSVGILPEIELYVYNHDYNNLRPVRIRPDPNWGGSGLLGFGVGYGLLHRLPVIERSGTNIQMPPGSTLFDAGLSDSDHLNSPFTKGAETGPDHFITPADLAVPHAPGVKSPKRRHRSTVTSDLSEYFAEEVEKSKQLEGNRPVVSDNAVPPPPKGAANKKAE